VVVCVNIMRRPWAPASTVSEGVRWLIAFSTAFTPTIKYVIIIIIIINAIVIKLGNSTGAALRWLSSIPIVNPPPPPDIAARLAPLYPYLGFSLL